VPPGAFSDALAREALDDLAEEARAAADATPPPGGAPRAG
jgi:hypothetical protein